MTKFNLINLNSKKLSDAVDVSAGFVHVWLAHLDISAVQILNLSNTLSKDEQDKAKRFIFEQHRNHFIARRGFLRLILSRYLGLKPDLLRFRYNSFGKPMLDAAPEEQTLQFNLSHSKGIALYVFSKGECGIDIESLQHPIDFEALSKQFFAPNEVEAIRVLPEAEQHTMFFQLWTRKEAYIKAIGQGLSFPLNQFDVSLSPDKPILLNTTAGNCELTDWYVKNFTPREAYMAAIALKENHRQVSYFQAS